MMLNERHQPHNRTEGMIAAKMPEVKFITETYHCKECWVEVKSGNLCPPCKENESKGKMGFRKG